MKKELASRLNAIAEKLPILFEEKVDHILIKGSELLLTPLASIVEDREKFYSVEIPKYVAVEHKQQVKDAYKRGGWQEVDKYCLIILANSNALDGVDLQAVIEKRNSTTKEALKKLLGNSK